MSHFALKAFCLAALAALPPVAQPGPPDDRGGPPLFERRGRDFNPVEAIHDALDISDQKWNTLEPKVAKVIELQREAMGPRVGGPPGAGLDGPGGGRDENPGVNGLPFARNGGGPPDNGGGPNGGDGPNGGGPGGGPNGGGPGGGRPPPGGNGPTSRPTSRPARGRRGPASRPSNGSSQSPNAGPRSVVQDRLNDLRDALDDKNAKPEVLQAKVAAYHQARDQAKAELLKAQADLRASLNPTQEATLIVMNVLD